MKIEVINTGTELLLGHVTNTHLPWLAQQLFGLGWRVQRQVTVPDGEAIRTAVQEARQRAELIIITGGLGPTSDDITREVIAELLGRKLVFHEEIYAKILDRFARRKLVVPEIVRVQAMVPEGATILANDNGTAPGLILEEGPQTFILLPGPPRELQLMWKNQALPWLKAHRQSQPLYEKIWRIVGMGESRVQELCEERIRQLGDFEVGYCARPGEVDFRLIGPDPHKLEEAGKIVWAQVGESIVGEGNENLETTVIRLAVQLRKKIATAESCTGGLVAHRLTNVPGSSAVFGFGWVTYAYEAKTQELGVSTELLQTHGAISEACVKAMAEGALRQSGADLAVAISGIAGPGGGTPEKPVGTCWLAVSTAAQTTTTLKMFSTDRESFKHMASQAALDLLRRSLIAE
jgi:nicotinamide-nucleotide amidase